MKKIIRLYSWCALFVIICCLILSLAACGKDISGTFIYSGTSNDPSERYLEIKTVNGKKYLYWYSYSIVEKKLYTLHSQSIEQHVASSRDSISGDGGLFTMTLSINKSGYLVIEERNEIEKYTMHYYCVPTNLSLDEWINTQQN